MSELKLQQAALERDNLELRDRLGEERRRNKPPVMPRSTLLATSTPINSQQASQVMRYPASIHACDSLPWVLTGQVGSSISSVLYSGVDWYESQPDMDYHD
jgi:hypothetical protein